ncbi:MAG TPA: AtpZ/AtpI family protein [Candidatus Binataceae bacterium]|nr:AtpZ/AtpI family protein [Candidatus Binataceae bacterium]
MLVVLEDQPDHRLQPEDRALGDAVERAHHRRVQWLRSGEWPLGRALAMMGRFGWAIVVPTLLGVLIGRWLDRVFATGVMFSAALVMLGAAAGFWMVWNAMHVE